MAINTPEQWAALQAKTDEWAADVSDERLGKFVRALQLNWRETRSADAWDQLQCLYAVQQRRSSSRG
jgi:hypothetical protein